jgi:hypothetical protein
MGAMHWISRLKSDNFRPPARSQPIPRLLRCQSQQLKIVMTWQAQYL